MRTTVDLDEKLLKEARKLTGIKKKTHLLEQALREMIGLIKRQRIIKKLGTLDFDPKVLEDRHRR